MSDFAGFSDFSWALRPCAVYVLLRQGKVVYAGQSIAIAGRLQQHRNLMERKKRGLPIPQGQPDPVIFDRILVKFVPKAELDREELALIQKYLPEKNKLMKREAPKVDLTQQPFFQNLLAKRRPDAVVRRRKFPVVHRRAPITLPYLKFLEEDARA